MNRTAFLFLGFLLLIMSKAQAQGLSESLRKRVDFELHTSTPSDELIEIARAADVNFIADATHLAPTATAVPTRWPGKQPWALWNLIIETTTGRRLTWEPYGDERTFLFWKEPDITAIGQRMAAGEGIKLEDKLLDQRALHNLMVDYLQHVQGWDGRSPDFSKDIKISSLPPELRREIVARAQGAILGHPSLALLKAPLTEAYWQQVRLTLVHSTDKKQPEEALWLNFSTPHAHSRDRLAVLKTTEK